MARMGVHPEDLLDSQVHASLFSHGTRSLASSLHILRVSKSLSLAAREVGILVGDRAELHGTEVHSIRSNRKVVHHLVNERHELLPLTLGDRRRAIKSQHDIRLH